MGSVVELYEALASAPDERARARVIAEAFERLEELYPNLPNLVTHQQLGETELRIRREIEQLRGDLRATELRLQKEIEQLRGEVKTEIEQLRGEVKTGIEQLRGEVKTEIEQLRGEVRTAIERSRNSLLMWLIPLMFAQVGAMAALVKLL
jgi:type VI protein secretion system component VasF